MNVTRTINRWLWCLFAIYVTGFLAHKPSARHDTLAAITAFFGVRI